MSETRRALRLFLWAYGATELLALVGLFMPRSWMGLVHDAMDLGQLPSKPMFFFLARVASLMYAVHGAVVIFVSFDLVHYARLITFIGALLLLQGSAVMVMGICESVPLWWALGDGSAVIVCGAIILLLQWLSREPPARTAGPLR